MGALAVIKFGSTSATLLAAERLDKPQLRLQRLINLFSEDGPHKALVWAQEMRQTIRQMGIEPLAAGGEGLRLNSQLQSRLQSVFPLWWPLTAELEGRLAWMAVKAKHPSCDVVVDIGGGSTEIVTGDKTASYPVGTARTGRSAWGDFSQARNPVFIGGTAVSLAKHASHQQLCLADVTNFSQALTDNTALLEGLDPLRREILPKGLALIKEIVTQNNWPQWEVSEYGLTEGLWLAASLGRVAR